MTRKYSNETRRLKHKLYAAFENGNFDEAKKVLDNDQAYKENIFNYEDERPPLCYALVFWPKNNPDGLRKIVAYLLHKGANVESENSYDKTTALQYAAQRNDFELMRLFLDVGANIEKINEKQETVVHWIALCENGDNVGKLFFEYIFSSKKEEFIKRIINIQDNGMDTALHYSANRSLIITKKLLELGANPNIKDDINKVPLYISLFSRNFEISLELLVYGADIDINRENLYCPKNILEELYTEGKLKDHLLNKYYELMKKYNLSNLKELTTGLSKDDIDSLEREKLLEKLEERGKEINKEEKKIEILRKKRSCPGFLERLFSNCSTSDKYQLIELERLSVEDSRKSNNLQEDTDVKI